MKEKESGITGKMAPVRKWIRANKFLAAIIMVVMVAAPVATAVVFELDHQSGFTLSLSKAPISLTTTVSGNATNVNLSPVEIQGNYYNETNFASFKSTSTANTGSTVKLGDISGFINGDYLRFNVTVTNSGHITVNLTNYSIKAYFVNSDGQGIAPPPGYPANYTLTNETLTSSAFGGDTLQQDIAYLNSNTYNNNWFYDNSIESQTFTHVTLKPGQSFHYTLFMGLGSQAAYNIPSSGFSLTIHAEAVH